MDSFLPHASDLEAVLNVVERWYANSSDPVAVIDVDGTCLYASAALRATGGGIQIGRPIGPAVRLDGPSLPLHDLRGRLIGRLVRPIASLRTTDGTLLPPSPAQPAVDQQLLQDGERYRAFVAQSTEGIWRFELDQPLPIELSEDQFVDEAYRYGYLAECNDAMAKMYGFDRAEQIVGARLGDLLVRDDPSNIEYLRAFCRSSYKLIDAESHEVDRNGSDKYFLNNLIGVIESNHLQRAWGTQRDITDRKQMEEALRQSVEDARQARDAAEAANRAKTEFLSVLSHELRTPLTPMLLIVTLLEQNTEIPADAREDLASIRQNIELEARLIDDLLDISRITRGKLHLNLKPIDLHQAVRGAIEIARAQEVQPVLRIELQAKHTSINGDMARLQQIVWNLLSNAIKFTPRTGTITVRTDDVLPGKVALSVIDTGVGIDPTNFEKIFNAFELGGRASTRQFGGLGVGLSIAKFLATAHQGTLSVDSAGKGCGATFRLILPTIPG